jgi:hypothetical protein
MKMNGTAYVNLGPDNGGIILNLSEEGLSFESRAAIEHTETIRLWISYRSRRTETDVNQVWKDQEHITRASRFIEVGSELLWTDDTRKRGGVRFTNLSDKTRREIREWMGQEALVCVNGKPTPQVSPGTRTYKTPWLLSSARFAGSLWKIQSARPGIGFSGGVVTGILISAFAVAVFSLFTYRRELGIHLGNSLVQLGEQLKGRSSVPTNSREPPLSAPAPQPVSQVSESTPLASETVAAPIQAPQPERPPKITRATAESRHRNLENAASGTPTERFTASRPLVPRIDITPITDPDTSPPPAPAPEMELTNRLGVYNESLKVEGALMGSEKYLEVGKFKQKPLADYQTSRLSQLGFPVKLIQRAHFAGKSYQVLVGPYRSDAEAEAVHTNLASFGFTPRSYERGTRDFRLPHPFEVGSKRLPVGDCVISWESYRPNAIVKFEGDNGSHIIVDARWVKQGARYYQNAVVYRKNRDGSFNLLEIYFYGMAEALVLDRGSN